METKTNKKLLTLILAIAATCGPVLAQKKKEAVAERTDASRFNWDKSKLIPNLKKLDEVEPPS